MCDCGKGHKSRWDLRCGHCRTRKETEAHGKALDKLAEYWVANDTEAVALYRKFRNLQHI